METVNTKGERFLFVGGGSKPYVLSAETRQITKISEIEARPGLRDSWVGHVKWIGEDRLIWKQEANKIIATDFDGSNPKELFRIEDGKFYLYGEEHS
jgi:hypothetical protein